MVSKQVWESPQAQKLPGKNPKSVQKFYGRAAPKAQNRNGLGELPKPAPKQVLESPKAQKWLGRAPQPAQKWLGEPKHKTGFEQVKTKKCRSKPKSKLRSKLWSKLGAQTLYNFYKLRTLSHKDLPSTQLAHTLSLEPEKMIQGIYYAT